MKKKNLIKQKITLIDGLTQPSSATTTTESKFSPVPYP